MNNVTIALNNQIEASEAARQLGCAYSTVVALLAKKKLKGQKINRRWFVDFNDLQRAKSTHLIKTRVSRKQRERAERQAAVSRPAPVPEMTKVGNGHDKTELRFYVDKNKLNVLQMALQSVDKNLADYVNEKMDELHEKIRQSLKSLKV
jgi:hypothetical protein